VDKVLVLGNFTLGPKQFVVEHQFLVLGQEPRIGIRPRIAEALRWSCTIAYFVIKVLGVQDSSHPNSINPIPSRYAFVRGKKSSLGFRFKILDPLFSRCFPRFVDKIPYPQPLPRKVAQKGDSLPMRYRERYLYSCRSFHLSNGVCSQFDFQMFCAYLVLSSMLYLCCDRARDRIHSDDVFKLAMAFNGFK